ncbi:MAG: hypothetical protein KA973_15605 [Candidatus Microthrix sp.]|uniref:Uncharacterized protein n=1 Tax=Candidatus Neomicrothrix parvicella RN1 TaxID=1229780 RepID=R4Z444_9ACTN|nr:MULTISPECIES: hypothetical protein [Microthrix]MBL0202803.1 hypothetical protein [Candidatus Microthrix sp.]MBP7406337.1 hypothetical protein [Candidatus Microthrix sp.]MBP7877604.1 hypothetical protein [Candidatus Microthrix sp.]MBP7988309.1 hypothetical protein [Candidatus Microthrix sp.]CCM64081.1 hypothetical protein BN381_330066 [Candidatus Microthrix parvicella RN1]
MASCTSGFTLSTSLELLVLAAVGVLVRLRQYASGRSLWLDEATFANNFVDHNLG